MRHPTAPLLCRALQSLKEPALQRSACPTPPSPLLTHHSSNKELSKRRMRCGQGREPGCGHPAARAAMLWVAWQRAYPSETELGSKKLLYVPETGYPSRLELNNFRVQTPMAA